MKTIFITGDYPGWTYISEIISEMRAVDTRFALRHPELAAQRNPLEPLLLKKFPRVDINVMMLGSKGL